MSDRRVPPFRCLLLPSLLAILVAPMPAATGQTPAARFPPPSLPAVDVAPAAATPPGAAGAPHAVSPPTAGGQDYQRHHYRSDDPVARLESMESAAHAPSAGGVPSAPLGDQPAPEHRLLPIEGGQIVARVGGEVVLAAEVLIGWKSFLAENRDKIPPGQLETVRRQFMQNQLERVIETKLLYGDARRVIPEENFPKIEASLGEQFDKDRLPQLYKSTRTSTLSELEDRLHAMGTSLAQQKRSFIESVLAQQWLRQKARPPGEITHDALWTYYQEHLADFEFEARARWEEVVARFDRFPSKEAAHRAIVEWGNLIWFGRATLAEVARKHSHGVTADEGGYHDWTTKGSLRSSIVDQALFSLPVGKLSRILEDDRSFRIVRVLERTPAGRTPFDEAQPAIRKQIRKGQTEAQFKAYLADLRKKTPIWTAFGENASAKHAGGAKLQGGG